MPRKRRCESPHEDFDEDYDEELYSNESRNPLQPPIQRNAANARERARMRVLSSAFCRLKTRLPWVPADTKLSKLDTLRLATIYIQQLRASLSKDNDDDDDTMCNVPNSQSMVWPFSFQQHIHSNNNNNNNKQLTNNIGFNQWITRNSSDICKQYTNKNNEDRFMNNSRESNEIIPTTSEKFN